MVTRRRVLLVVAVVIVAALAWTAWLSYRTARDLRDAEHSATQLRAALQSGDAVARDQALADLQASASSAHHHTDGLWWGAMTHTPVLGDDAQGVADLSASLDLVANQAVGPLDGLLDGVDGLVGNGKVDVDRLAALQPPVSQAASDLTQASELVDRHDSSGFVGPLRSRYDEYTGLLDDLTSAMGAADTALQVLPDMLGGHGPRSYLVLFENNAEIRASGGLPGSWALVTADHGKLSIGRQGSANDFAPSANGITPLKPGEAEIFDKQMVQFFQDPNFTPDFPRAAQIFDAFWTKKYPADQLDGVVAFDVVGLSYLLDGLGGVPAGDYQLTSANAVQTLLSDVYQIPDPAQQDVVFQAVARSVFGALTAGPSDPLQLVRGLARAAGERRLLVAPFHRSEAEALDGTAVADQLSRDDGATPHVDLAVNDATAAKMSYYLRYQASVTSTSCTDGVQTLHGSAQLHQTVTAKDAKATLPPYVLGSDPTFDRGTQYVRVHIIGPAGGTVSKLEVNGKPEFAGKSVMLDGRPVLTAAVLLDSPKDTTLDWTMTTGSGQTGDGVVDVTPGIEPGSLDSGFASTCS